MLKLAKPIDVVPYAPKGRNMEKNMLFNWLQHDFWKRNAELPEKNIDYMYIYICVYLCIYLFVYK